MYASSYLAIDCYTVEEALNLYTLSNYICYYFVMFSRREYYRD